MERERKRNENETEVYVKKDGKKGKRQKNTEVREKEFFFSHERQKEGQKVLKMKGGGSRKDR